MKKYKFSYLGIALSICLLGCGEKTSREKALDDVQDKMYYKAKYSAMSYSDFSADGFKQHYLNDSVVFCIETYSYKDQGRFTTSKVYGYFLLQEGFAEDITDTPDYYVSDEKLNLVPHLMR